MQEPEIHRTRRCSTSAFQSGPAQRSTMMHSTLSNSFMFKMMCLGLMFGSFTGKASSMDLAVVSVT